VGEVKHISSIFTLLLERILTRKLVLIFVGHKLRSGRQIHTNSKDTERLILFTVHLDNGTIRFCLLRIWPDQLIEHEMLSEDVVV